MSYFAFAAVVRDDLDVDEPEPELAPGKRTLTQALRARRDAVALVRGELAPIPAPPGSLRGETQKMGATLGDVFAVAHLPAGARLGIAAYTRSATRVEARLTDTTLALGFTPALAAGDGLVTGAIVDLTGDAAELVGPEGSPEVAPRVRRALTAALRRAIAGTPAAAVHYDPARDATPKATLDEILANLAP